MKRLIALSLLFVVAACGESPTEVSNSAADGLFTPSFSLNAADYTNDVTYGMLHGTVRFWNTAVQSVSAGTFDGNTAVVEPGASLTMTGNWQIGPVTDVSYCPGCIIELYAAWIPDAGANGATPFNTGIWKGQTYSTNPNPGASGSFTFNTQAPTVPGLYYVGRGQTLDYVFQPWAQGGFGHPTSGDPTEQAASFIIQVQANPDTKDECKKGGWEYFGFKNQGQCVRYIETGKDSR